MAIKINPGDPIPYSYRGNIKTAIKDYHGVLDDLNKSIKLDSIYNSEAYDNRGEIKDFLYKDYHGAINDYTRAIEITNDDPLFYLQRAYAKKELKDYEGALLDCSKVMELDPKNGDNYELMGIIKIEMGQKGGGCKDLIKAKSLGDKDADKQIKKYCR